MPIYQSSEQFYTCARALFEQLQVAYPEAAQAVQQANLMIRFQCTKPEVVLFINGRRDPVAIKYGPVRLRPELDVHMTTDTLHRILLGELSLGKALSSKAIRVKGPIWKTLSLATLFEQSQQLYPQILKEQKVL